MGMSLAKVLDDPRVPPVEVQGLASDSRRVQPGDVFFAYRGRAFDGHAFAADAVAAGAVAVVSERALDAGVPNVVVADLGPRLGGYARRFYGAPSRRLVVLGVTGTNGKTTVAYNISQLSAATGYMGTLGWGLPGALCAADMTTADPISLTARLKSLQDQGCAAVALEVSSHALDQGRIDAVDVGIGVFTNLTRDHLDYHGTLERYGAAKAKLFERPLARGAVVNADDALGRTIIGKLRRQTRTISYGTRGEVSWEAVRYSGAGIDGRWRTPWGAAAFTLPGYYGEFSVYNAAAVLASCCLLDTPLADAVDAMAALAAVPGRMQVVSKAPRVLVDYAHTPDALQAALAAVRCHVADTGRVIVVFGCGGDRDRGKRAEMARVAELGADVVIATSDNPRTEPPERILDDIEAGFSGRADFARIADRAAAISAAIARARALDVVLLAGKGHETYQETGGARIPFSDVDAVRAALPPQEPQEPQEEVH